MQIRHDSLPSSLLKQCMYDVNTKSFQLTVTHNHYGFPSLGGSDMLIFCMNEYYWYNAWEFSLIWCSQITANVIDRTASNKPNRTYYYVDVMIVSQESKI